MVRASIATLGRTEFRKAVKGGIRAAGREWMFRERGPRGTGVRWVRKEVRFRRRAWAERVSPERREETCSRNRVRALVMSTIVS